MVIEWNEQSVRWFQAASYYTGFHQNLMRLLKPSLPEGGTLCDLGCGAAMIDFVIADYLGAITCVDRDANVLRAVDAKIARDKRINMETLCEDTYSLSGQWDTALLLFYGKFGEHIQEYLRLCRENVVAVVRGGSRDDLGLGQYKPPKARTIAKTAAALDAKAVNWQLTESIMEYGQPLESLEDAGAYVRAYRKNPPGEDPETYLERSLVKTNDSRYPYYLPYQKHIGIFTVSKQNNLHLLVSPYASAGFRASAI